TPTIWVVGPSLAELAQDRANVEAMRTGASTVPADVSTTGSTVGFVPQSSPTAPALPLAVPSSPAWAMSANDDGDPAWPQHPFVQFAGGSVGGVALGYVPIAGPAVSLLADAGVLGPTTREARI